MAWSTPLTFVSGAKHSAAALNAGVRDDLLALYAGEGGGFTAYTPTLTGSTSPTLNCRWIRTGGDLITVEVDITLTGTVSALLTLTLPTTPASASGVALGPVTFNDTSASDTRLGAARLSGTVVVFAIQSSATAWANATAGVPWTWASGDSIRGILQYREA